MTVERNQSLISCNKVLNLAKNRNLLFHCVFISFVCLDNHSQYFDRNSISTNVVVFAILGDIGFGSWSPWSECSAECDGGISERSRKCPRERYHCEKHEVQQKKTCNTHRCPSKNSSLSHGGCANLHIPTQIILKEQFGGAAGVAKFFTFNSIMLDILCRYVGVSSTSASNFIAFSEEDPKRLWSEP